MSINDATIVASAAANSTASKKVTKALNNNIIAKTLHSLTRKCYKCYNAKSYDQLPMDDIADLNPEIFAHHSGPDVGIEDVTLASFRKPKPQPTAATTTEAINIDELPSLKLNSIKEELTNSVIAASPSNERELVDDCWDSLHKCRVTKWNVCHHRAYGIACSLYENNPVANYTVGDPIADVYALLARKNNSILVLADGVNWGPRSRLAARCAVRACLNFINRNLFCSSPPNSSTKSSSPLTTHDLFRIICRGFDAAQEFILKRKGTMTTLCCSVVVRLRDAAATMSSNSSSSASNSASWVVCTLSIGDSTAYVFNKTKGVFELTQGARNINNDRDMRNVGGALGHVYGIKPDVSNLNYSLMYIKENDIVFLVSDGVSDNLDPIVSQTARRQKQPVDPSLAESIYSVDQTSAAAGIGNKSPIAKVNRSASQLSSKSNSKPSSNGLFMTPMKKSSSSNSSPNSSCDSTKNREPSLASNMNSNETVERLSKDDQSIHLSSLPEMSPYERYMCSLAHMNEILLRNKTLNDDVSAQETCAILIEHVMRLTANKRDILEKGLVEASSLPSEEERTNYQARLRERVQKLRGKLDHASIVAYEVGTLQ